MFDVNAWNEAVAVATHADTDTGVEHGPPTPSARQRREAAERAHRSQDGGFLAAPPRERLRSISEIYRDLLDSVAQRRTRSLRDVLIADTAEALARDIDERILRDAAQGILPPLDIT